MFYRLVAFGRADPDKKPIAEIGQEKVESFVYRRCVGQVAETIFVRNAGESDYERCFTVRYVIRVGIDPGVELVIDVERVDLARVESKNDAFDHLFVLGPSVVLEFQDRGFLRQEKLLG